MISNCKENLSQISINNHFADNDIFKFEGSEIFKQGKPYIEIESNSFQKIFDKSDIKKSYSLEETKIETKNSGNYPGNKTIIIEEDLNINDISAISTNSENKDDIINIKHHKVNLNKKDKNSKLELYDLLCLFFFNFMYCPKCKLDIIISLTCNFNFINIECKCSLIRNISIDKFKKVYSKDEKTVPLNKCEIHKKKFIAYCTDCRINLCQECKDEIIDNVKTHATHSKINADCEITKEEKLKLEKIIKENQNLKIFQIIKEYYYSFIRYPSYQKYKTIKNIISFFEKYPKFPKDFFSKNIELKEEKLIKIYTLEELNAINNDYESIYSIDIDNKNSEKSMNLNFFSGKIFTNLEILNLNGLKINSIKPLLTSKFPNLKLFHFDRNEINDDSINIFKYLNLPKIESISLFENRITSIKIFDAMKKFETLLKLYLGKNKFSFDKIDEYFRDKKDEEKIQLPPNLIELGISCNFTKLTSKFIKKIGLEKVQNLYIYKNKLNSLKIFDDIHFINLKKIWLNKTIISDIGQLNHLKNKKNIETINLTGNKFRKNKNIEFIASLESFPKLKKLILLRCGLPKKRIVHIMKRINRRRGNKKDRFIIIYKKNQ